jgi:hypothetical protein
MFKFDWSRIQPKAVHWLTLAGSVFVGAVVGYLQSQPTSSIFGALQSWQTAKPLLIGAVVAGVGAVWALAQHTFIAPNSTPTSEGKSKPAPVAKLGDSGHLRTSLVRAFTPWAIGGLGLIGVTGMAAVVSTESGCTAAEAANILNVLKEIQTWANTFLSGAQVLWQLILAAIPAASQAQANQAFVNAEATLTDALAAAEAISSDATTASIANTIAAVNAAVQAVEQIVEQWSGASADASGSILAKPGVGAHVSALHDLAAKIQSVRP